MATEVIHEHVPTAQSEGSSMTGFVLGVIFLIVLAILAFYYFGALRGFGWSGGGTQINVPRSFDVNVNK